jgi:hypothetical protein
MGRAPLEYDPHPGPATVDLMHPGKLGLVVADRLISSADEFRSIDRLDCVTMPAPSLARPLHALS